MQSRVVKDENTGSCCHKKHIKQLKKCATADLWLDFIFTSYPLYLVTISRSGGSTLSSICATRWQICVIVMTTSNCHASKWTILAKTWSVGHVLLAWLSRRPCQNKTKLLVWRRMVELSASYVLWRQNKHQWGMSCTLQKDFVFFMTFQETVICYKTTITSSGYSSTCFFGCLRLESTKY